jgi:hypothetical protein
VNAAPRCCLVWRPRAGFYIITYALGIYNLNLLLGFLTPQVDPELEGPTLPSKREDEFRPFVRRLPEFKFWRAPLPPAFPHAMHSTCMHRPAQQSPAMQKRPGC